MSLGLKRGTVRLEPHDLTWEQSARKVIAVLGERGGKPPWKKYLCAL